MAKRNKKIILTLEVEPCGKEFDTIESIQLDIESALVDCWHKIHTRKIEEVS